jgi:Zn-dependent M32 family carboxypeptidase
LKLTARNEQQKLTTMRKLLTIILTAFSLTTFGQTVKEMTPTLGYLVDRSSEGEIEFIKSREKCETVWEKIQNQNDYEKLSPEDKKIYDNCDETYENYWDILGMGCNWYEGYDGDKILG